MQIMTLLSAAAIAAAALCGEAQAQKRLADAERELADLVHDPLRAFLAETPASCSSEAARAARTMAIGLMSRLPDRFPITAKLAVGSAALDAADGFRDRGCASDARAIYGAVMRVYIGTGFAGLRDRAMVGLADLRR